MNEFFSKVKAYIQDPANSNFVYTSLALIVTGVFAIAIFYFASRTSEPEETIDPSEEQRVLSEIIRNNPKSILPELDESDTEIEDQNDSIVVNGSNRNETKTVVDNKTGKKVTVNNSNPVNTSPIPSPKVGVNGEYVDLSEEDIILPDLSLYNYRETITTTTHGPGFEICDLIFEGGCGGYYISPSYKPHNGEVVVSKDFAFFDRSHSYYRSDIEVDGESARTDIGLYGSDINVNYSSAFGEVYLENIAEPYEWFSNSESWLLANSYSEDSPASYPNSYIAPENVIASQFGSNVILSDPYEEDGREIYEVTLSYFVTCNDERRPLFSVYKVAGDTFEILSRSEYIDEVSEDTLRFTQTVSTSRRTVSYEEIEATFTNDDLPGTAVTVDRTDYEYDSEVRGEQIINYLAEYNIDVLKLEDSTELINIWGARFPGYLDNENLYMQRNYYADTNLGEAMFEQLNEYLDKSPVASIYWEGNNPHTTRIYNTNALDLDDLVPDETSTDYYFTVSFPVSFRQSIFGSEAFESEAYRSDTYYYATYPTSYPISYALSYSTSYPSSYSNSRYDWLQTYGPDFYFEIDSYLGSVSLDSGFPFLVSTVELISGQDGFIIDLIRDTY